MSYAELRFESRDEWLTARDGLGVGASEVAALFNDPENPLRGVSSFDSPVSLSFRKRGLIPREERTPEDEEHLEWSTYIEPAIAGWFDAKVRSEKDPFLTMRDPGQWTIQVPTVAGVPWFCTLDRELCDEAGEEQAIVEIKNASLFMGGEWENEPPLAYILQVQTQLAVTGLPYGYVVAAIGGRAPKWARVNRDQKVIDIIAARVTKFWESVQRNEDPPMDAHPKTASALLHRWPLDDGERVALPQEIAEAWDQRVIFAKNAAAAELEKDLRTAQIKHAIGEARFGDLPDGRSLSLKTDRAGRRNLKEVGS